LEQIKRLLTDGIISISSLMSLETFQSSLPIMHQFVTRLNRTLNQPNIKIQIEQFYNNPNYTWKKLFFILTMNMIIDKIFNP
jgi:hypothetical protein